MSRHSFKKLLNLYKNVYRTIQLMGKINNKSNLN